MVNKVILLGRIGQDIELKTVGEHKVVNLSLATNDGYGDNKVTNWHNVSFWNKQAQVIDTYSSKGDLLYVEGVVNYKKDKNDIMRTQINGDKFEFVGASNQDKIKNNVSEFNPNFDDDVPF